MAAETIPQLHGMEEAFTNITPEPDDYPGKKYQRLFDAINNAAPNPVQGQMDDIIQIVQEDFTPAIRDEGQEELVDKWNKMQADIQKAMDKWDDEQRGKAQQAMIDLSKIIITI